VLIETDIGVVGTASIPAEVLLASEMPWGVLIDAYLIGAARVGDRYAGVAYLDHSGVIVDGSTVATPPVRAIDQKDKFILLQTLSGLDHYVIAAWR
jgi:hypothetical protein